MQERIQAAVMESYVEHKPLDEYLINTHAFHNAHLIREILPRGLTSPIPFRTARHSYHLGIASQLRKTQDAKRKATALKKVDKSKANAPVAAGSDQPRTEIVDSEEPYGNGQQVETDDL